MEVVATVEYEGKSEITSASDVVLFRTIYSQEEGMSTNSTPCSE